MKSFIAKVIGTPMHATWARMAAATLAMAG
jgi:hypothetical protein